MAKKTKTKTKTSTKTKNGGLLEKSAKSVSNKRKTSSYSLSDTYSGGNPQDPMGAYGSLSTNSKSAKETKRKKSSSSYDFTFAHNTLVSGSSKSDSETKRKIKSKLYTGL